MRKKQYFFKILLNCIIVFLIIGCHKSQLINVSAELYHKSTDKVTEIMIHDIFSPPVASRIFVYPNIAAYEIIANHNPQYKSLKGQVRDWEGIEDISKSESVDVSLASLIAFIEMSKNLIFSENRIKVYQDSLYDVWKSENEKVFHASKVYAMEVVSSIKLWMEKDNYNQTRTMPKYSVNLESPSRWQPTPPSYMDAIEPHWNKIRPLVIKSVNQFKPEPPPPFSLDKSSIFYKELKEVYDISNEITEKGDNSESVAVAQFWDCNPYVSVTRGHLMFATKKITPGAHWMGICRIACEKTNSDFSKTIFAATKTSIAIFDAFISCWDEKYRSNLIRPETLINQHIDEDWKPILQTPPFPEYTSGHSVVSGAASVALTSIFGDTFSFEDNTEIPYGLPVRSFKSFYEASSEAAISRLYGGIHYRKAVFEGLKQGKSLGRFIVENIKMNP